MGNNDSSTYVPRRVNVVKERPPTVNYFPIRWCYNDFFDFDTAAITQQGKIIFEEAAFLFEVPQKHSGDPCVMFHHISQLLPNSTSTLVHNNLAAKWASSHTGNKAATFINHHIGCEQ